MRSIQVLISVLIFFLPLTASGLEITLHPMAEVSTDFVLLSDIATFSETSPFTKALGSKRISSTPQIGKKITIQRSILQKKLTREFNIKTNLLWKGPATTIISRKGTQITPDAMLISINNFLKNSQGSLPKAEYSFTPRELPLPFEIRTGNLEIKVIPSDPDIIGSSRFTLLYLVNGKIAKNISIRGKLVAMAPVAVLTRGVKRGSILHPDMLKMEPRDLSTLRTPCTDLRRVLGKILTKRLRNGSILDLSMVEFPPVIHKGDLVKMILKHNGLTLTASGMSYMNGKQDQIIKVKNIRSNKSVFCKVSSPGIVEVQI
ncbi:MAG: flagella basal body P-ring formation protein FlgA [Desulfocapsa sp.]|nr:MAG: flagella basal body P-ring formation protein FlgA [Desulfocapsa sp.]